MSGHEPHWVAGPATQSALTDQAAAERFAHITYGELVKHFGLGSTHTFSSWDKLSQEEREKWVAAFTDVQTDLKEHPTSKARPPS